MREFDVVVVGGGTGNNTAAAAADAGLETALVEKGRLGGTCLNRGCNPSKMQLARARAADSVREAEKFGVHASIDGIDFAEGVRETNDLLFSIADGMEERYRTEKDTLTVFKTTAEFVDERTLSLDGENEDVYGEKVVVAAGTRPIVPPIDGLDEVDYLTSTDALRLTDRPDSIVVLGGGYIAAELGYYFEALGTEVTIIEMLDSLVPREDGEIAEAFTGIADRRHDVYTGYRATAVEAVDGRVTVHAEAEDGEARSAPDSGSGERSEPRAGETVAASGEEVLLALGRRPNTDTLNVEAAGIATDEKGFVDVDEQLRSTSAENVWAQGDIAGNYLFKHTGDYETGVVSANVVEDAGREVDYTGVGHAIFTEPQIGATGRTEEQLQEAGVDYVVGRHDFADTSMGRALKLEDGFAKALVAPDGEILGCHVLGHEASVLIHEVIATVRAGGDARDLADAIYVHPALSKVIRSAFQNAVAKLDG